MKVHYNLNDPVRVRLTDHGKDIYYHQYDIFNALSKIHGLQIIRPRYPETDEDGYSRMQLWRFIEIYGPYISMTKPNVIEPLELEFEIDMEENKMTNYNEVRKFLYEVPTDIAGRIKEEFFGWPKGTNVSDIEKWFDKKARGESTRK